jgi:hypothetical protein
MPRASALAVASLAVALAAGPALAQPSGKPDQLERAINPYVYLMDKAGHKVLVSTQIWRNDPKYDDRSFHRFLDVLAQLEKRGFEKSEKATIQGWDKPQPFARCYIYLEDMQNARGAKPQSGARVWCTETGISEIDVRNSDGPKHVAEVMQKFDMMLDKSKKGLQK